MHNAGHDIVICGLKTVPSSEGGIEYGAEEVGVRLKALGHRVTVYCRGEQAGRREHRGMVIHDVPHWPNKYLCYFSYMARVFWQVVRNHGRGTIVHIHSPVVNGLWVIFFRVMGYRVFVHSHGLEWRASKWPQWFKLVMRLSAWCGALAANRLLCVSEEEARCYVSKFHVVRRKVMVVPNGRPTQPSPLPSEVVSRLTLESSGYYLFVGRLVPQKRVTDLIDAFIGAGSAKRLVIVGGGSFSDSYVRKVRKAASASERILLAGWIERGDLWALYRNSFAFVLPSDHEGCPNALVEAATCGCVCVVSEIPAHLEIGQGDFLTFPPRDVSALRSVLRKLERLDSEHERARQRSSAFPERWPTWDEIAKMVNEGYANC